MGEKRQSKLVETARKERGGAFTPRGMGIRTGGWKEIHPMKTMLTALATTLAAFGAGLPSTTDVVAKFVERDSARRAAMSGYSVTTRYHLENKDRRADMVVRWTRQADGVKRYRIISEEGDGAVRSHVFHKLLDAEVEASNVIEQERSRITPANYDFELTGIETVNGREALVLSITPRTDSKYLTRGRVWIDATDYAVIQIEGSPAHNPSFWTKSVSFTQTFEKNGDFWFVARNHSLTNARMFGLADLTIQYFDYKLHAGRTVSAE
jgi:hypothetical protein